VPSSKDVVGLEEGNNKFPETKVVLAAGLDFKVISTD